MSAPFAVRFALCPTQILAPEVAVTFGKLFTVTVTSLLPEQPLLLPVIVYVVVCEGDAFTVFPDVISNPVAGLQFKLEAPVA